jgi:hypothetical protein
MERRVHKRYLDYRDCHVYFGRKKPPLSAADFVRMDAELGELEKRRGELDDEEAARFGALMTLLHRA